MTHLAPVAKHFKAPHNFQYLYDVISVDILGNVHFVAVRIVNLEKSRVQQISARVSIKAAG